MDKDEKTIDNVVEIPEEIAEIVEAPADVLPAKVVDQQISQISKKTFPTFFSKKPGKRRERVEKERVKPEFDTKIIDIRRVTRVASGGRRFTFSVAVVSGDKKGRVGVGLGKALDTSLAIDKATRNAKKNMIKINLSKNMTLPHAVEAKYSSVRIMMSPARGRGVVAGSSARSVIELAGVKDVCAKLLSGTKNHLNIARAAVKALSGTSKHQRQHATK